MDRSTPPPGGRLLRCDAPATAAGLIGVATRVQSFLREASITGDPAYTVSLALEELYTNLVRHAVPAPGRTAIAIEIIVRIDAGVIVLTIIDDGQPFDPLTRPLAPGPASAAEIVAGGRGLKLLREFAPCLSYQRADGNNVVEVMASLPRT